MRKFFLIIAVVCSAAAISCTKQGTGRFEGGWSYKMSGTVTVEVVTTSIVSGEITTETQTLSITNETGQMHIAPTGNGDEMVVTMSAIGAGVTVLDATAQGSSLIVGPTGCRLKVNLSNRSTLDFDVVCSGEGIRYDDMLILQLDFDGDAASGESTYTILESDVKCVANLNK